MAKSFRDRWGAHPPKHARGRDSVTDLFSVIMETIENLMASVRNQTETSRILFNIVERQMDHIDDLLDRIEALESREANE